MSQVSDTGFLLIALFNAFLAASWMILVWEAVITMEDEVQFVWACVLLLHVSMQNMTCRSPLVFHGPHISSGYISLVNTLRWRCKREYVHLLHRAEQR